MQHQFDKVAGSIDEVCRILADMREEIGERYSRYSGETYDLMNLKDAPGVVQELTESAFGEICEAESKANAARDRLGILRDITSIPGEIDTRDIRTDWIDAKHGVDGKRLRILVQETTEGSFAMTYEAKRVSEPDAFALQLLFTNGEYSWNGDEWNPVWTFKGDMPDGVVALFRGCLDRLGFHYIEWQGRVDLIGGQEALGRTGRHDGILQEMA